MELNDKKFAVLVDADNISHRKIKDILDEIANYGTPTIKRIYGDFTNPKFAAWKEVLLENSITPIQQYAYTTGKNATDSALIIDAMDILHKEGVDGFCIVSSDSDYTRLASRIRESGREVLGFGEKKTPKPFIKSCDKFIYVEILGQTPPEKAAPAKKKADAKRSAGAEAPVGPAAETAGEKKPSPDAGHASTIIRPFDDEFRTLLENTIDDAADDSGWASLGDVGSVLSKKMPDFDPRNYGYKKLSLLVRALSDAYVKGVAELCEKEDIVFMTDEVQCGNGRTGKLYAYEHYGVLPDVVSTAKGLGGGLPIGATMLGMKVENVFTPGKNGSTFGGNPIVCAGALSILKRLDDKFLAEVTRKGNFVKEYLAGKPGIERVSGLGLMIGVKTVKSENEVVAKMMENGVLALTAHGGMVRLLPPLNISDADLKKALDVLLAAAA